MDCDDLEVDVETFGGGTGGGEGETVVGGEDSTIEGPEEEEPS